jgi:hypothetical protein
MMRFWSRKMKLPLELGKLRLSNDDVWNQTPGLEIARDRCMKHLLAIYIRALSDILEIDKLGFGGGVFRIPYLVFRGPSEGEFLSISLSYSLDEKSLGDLRIRGESSRGNFEELRSTQSKVIERINSSGLEIGILGIDWKTYGSR